MFIFMTGLFTASIRVFIEMACEVSYPVAEGLTAGFLNDDQ